MSVLPLNEYNYRYRVQKVSAEAAYRNLLTLLPSDLHILYNYHISMLQYRQKICIWAHPAVNSPHLRIFVFGIKVTPVAQTNSRVENTLLLHRSQSQTTHDVALSQEGQNRRREHGQQDTHTHIMKLHPPCALDGGTANRHGDSRFVSQGQGK